MMAIGLGKQEGAAAYHEAMLTFGYPRVILSVAQKIMQSANVLFGVGIVENGCGQTAQIGICRSDDILEMEKKLFKNAVQFAPALPFDEADVLIIDDRMIIYSRPSKLFLNQSIPICGYDSRQW